jgi:kinesin family member 5
MKEEINGDIQVVCRFRPLNSKELQVSDSLCADILADDKTVSISQENGSPLLFTLDYIFRPSTSQEEVYRISAKSIVEAVLEGFNGTVLAYGQTSSGKTFTMTGSISDDPTYAGIIPRMIENVFDYICLADKNLEFTVKVGYCEIYMEKVKDLLDPSKKNLKVHEDKLKGVYIGDLSENYVNTESEVSELMKFGSDNREIGYTEMNAVSSRSHAIFIVNISQTNIKNYSTKTGKLYLVDLAGSEKIAKTGAIGKRLEEAKTINKSLAVLGQVIMSLTDGKSSHIPYRDSKLTRILQDSLGGNSKTSLITTCSPSIFNLEETISTLRFGVRAKSIKNKPKVNKEHTIPELKLMLAKAQQEIEAKNLKISLLQQELSHSGGQIVELYTEPHEIGIKFDDLQEEIETLKSKLEEETKTSAHLRNSLIQQENLSQEVALDNASMINELKSCYEEVLLSRTDIQEKIERIEELTNTNELLDTHIKEFNLKIVRLEQVVTEREIEIAKLKNLMHFGKEHSCSNENQDQSNLKIDLIIEKERVSSLNKQIRLLEASFEEMAKRKSPDLLLIQQNLKQQAELAESFKWIQERQSLNKDLQNRINKVIELELELDDSKENFRCFEQKVSQGEKNLIKRNEYLEKSIEYLTNLYYQILNEKSSLSVQNQVLQNKVSRINERIALLEEQINKQRDYSRFEDRSFAEDIAKLNNTRLSRTSQPQGNIRKPIKGGTKCT